MNTEKFYKTVLFTAVGMALSLPAQAIVYEYDDLNRLISAQYSSGKTLSYSYDAAGNLLSVQVSTTVPDGQIQLQILGPDGTPLTNITVTIDGATYTTDADGYVNLPAISGEQTVQVAGYPPTTVDFDAGPAQITLSAPENAAGGRFIIGFVHNKVGVYDLNGSPSQLFKTKSKQTEVAAGDFDADGVTEVAVASGVGGHTIALYELDGTSLYGFSIGMPGMALAAGDIDGDGIDELAAASNSSNSNQVTLYSSSGDYLQVVPMFDSDTKMNLAMGDLDGDGRDELIAGDRKADRVATYNFATGQWFGFGVFPRENTPSSAWSKVDDYGKDYFQQKLDDICSQDDDSLAKLCVEYGGKSKKTKGVIYGVQVAAGDVDGDGRAEIIAAADSKAAQVEIYEADGSLINTIDAGFYLEHGLIVTAGDLDGDGSDDILLGRPHGIRILGYQADGSVLLDKWVSPFSSSLAYAENVPLPEQTPEAPVPPDNGSDGDNSGNDDNGGDDDNDDNGSDGDNDASDDDNGGVPDTSANCQFEPNPDDAAISSNVEIGENFVIGTGSTLEKNVSIGDDVQIGEDVTINKNSAIGNAVAICDGTMISKQVVIDDNVNIASNVTIEKDVTIEPHVTIGEGTVVSKETVINSNASISADVTVERNVTIGSHVTIGEGTVISKETVINSNANISANVTVEKEVTIGSNATIGEGTDIRNTVVIEDNVTIGAYVTIGNGARIMEGAVVPANTEIGKNEVVKP